MAKRGQIGLSIGRVWGGIDRTVSTFDKRTEAAEVACDVELFPEGRLVSRAGYLALYNSPYCFQVLPTDAPSDVAQPAVLPSNAANVDVPKATKPSGAKQFGVDYAIGGSGDKLAIVAIHEWEQPNADGTTTQRHIIQCNDNLFYRYRFGNNPGWVVLENTYAADNVTEWYWKRLLPLLTKGGFSDAVTAVTRPVPNPHAHFWDHKGVLRMGLGTGAKAIPLWYGRIDRRFFTNDIAAPDNRFANWMLDVTPLQPPTIDNLNYNAADPFPLRWMGVDTHSVPAVGVNDLEDYMRGAWNWGAGDSPKLKNFSPFVGNAGGGEGNEWGWYPGIQPSEYTYTDDAASKEAQVIHFYVGLSFIYDGYQESQIYLVPDERINKENLVFLGKPNVTIPKTVMVGVVRRAANQVAYYYSYISVNLKSKLVTDFAVNGDNYPNRLNPRITSVRVWLGRVETVTQTAEETSFYPVKDIIISKKDEFDDKIWDGEHVWLKGDAAIAQRVDPDSYYFYCPIGANDWLEALKQGDYARINGHNIPLIDDKFGLQRSPFLEGYRYAEVVKDQVIYGGIRWFGEVREAHVIRGAVFSAGGGGEVQEDVMDCSPLDLEHQVQGLRKLDDDTLGIVTTSTVEKRTMPDLVKRHTASGGCSAPDSVIQADNAILFYKDGQMYLYNGVNDPRVVSDKYGRDSDDGVYIGLLNTNSHSNVWSFYLPVLRKQIIFCKDSSATWHCFVYDLKTRKYVEFKFYHTCHNVGTPAVARQFVAGCRGVDGEMDFTDGYYIYRFPIGLHDNGQVIQPVYQTADMQLPPELEAALNDLDVNHKTLIGTLNIQIRRDKGDLIAVTKTFDPNALLNNIKATKPIAYGTRITKSVALKFTITGATTASVLDVESAQLTMIPQETV